MPRILILVIFTVLVTYGAQAQAADFKTIAIVSIDALHPDALTARYAPLTCALLEKGQLTRRGASTSPPKTLIAHTAMLTGKGPRMGGRISNDWEPGEPTVQGRTLFDSAKERGYRTGYFYSKPKLGYLVSEAMDVAVLSREDATGQATRFLETGERNFVFIHVSGLDIVGPESGWLSPKYMEELSYIDQYLEEVYTQLIKTGSFLLIVTSDHAGYGRSHGGYHPEESQLPFGVVSDLCEFPEMEGAAYHVTELPAFIERAMQCSAAKP